MSYASDLTDEQWALLEPVIGRLELVLVDRGVNTTAAQELGQAHGVEVRRVG